MISNSQINGDIVFNLNQELFDLIRILKINSLPLTSIPEWYSQNVSFSYSSWQFSFVEATLSDLK